MTTCPGCGSRNVYNSGFKIECGTHGCSYFSKKQIAAASPTPSRASGPVTPKDMNYPLQRGKTYVLVCDQGKITGTTRNVAAGGSREIDFNLDSAGKGLREVTLQLEPDPGYQFTAALTADEESVLTLGDKSGFEEVLALPQGETLTLTVEP